MPRKKAKAKTKRKATPKQLRALAKGRAALKKARTKARQRNPSSENERLWIKVRNLERHVLAPPYTTKSEFFAESETERKKYYRWLQTQAGAYSDILETQTPKKRRRNPGPPTRGAVMARDLPGLTKGTGQRRMTQQRAIKRKHQTYKGLRSNPPHYVVKGPRGYFDGAGWASTKTGAAQFITKKKAASIAQKVANATNKPVSVIPV